MILGLMGACAPKTMAAAMLAASFPVEALAQTPSQTATPATADPNITPYPAAFFAEFRPITALDMIGRIPGFQFDGGTSARGFAGTEGNVLIDGERPPVRSDSLQSILSRIPAAQVLRIEIVRSGAGGIDMKGKAVVANVIRSPDGGISGSVGGTLSANTRGRFNPNLNLQLRRQWDGRSLEGAISASTGSGDDISFRERRSPSDALLLLGKSQGVYDYDNVEGTTVYEGPLGGGRIRLNGLLSTSGSGYEGSDILIVPIGGERSLSDSTSSKGELGIQWTRTLPAGMTLELIGSQSLSQSDNSGVYDTPDFTSESLSDNTRGESIASGSLTFASLETAHGSIDFEAGSEVAFNFVESATAYRFNNAPPFAAWRRHAGGGTAKRELRLERLGTALQPQASPPPFAMKSRASPPPARRARARPTLDFWKPRLNVAWTPAPWPSTGVQTGKERRPAVVRGLPGLGVLRHQPVRSGKPRHPSGSDLGRAGTL